MYPVLRCRPCVTLVRSQENIHTSSTVLSLQKDFTDSVILSQAFFQCHKLYIDGPGSVYTGKKIAFATISYSAFYASHATYKPFPTYTRSSKLFTVVNSRHEKWVETVTSNSMYFKPVSKQTLIKQDLWLEKHWNFICMY